MLTGLFTSFLEDDITGYVDLLRRTASLAEISKKKSSKHKPGFLPLR
jgi:hypothetical protein